MVLDILKYNIEDMTTYIINNINNISNEEKEEILRNKRVRERYFEEDNHYYFVYLVQRLGLNLSFFYDDDFLERLVKDKKAFDKLFALITCDSLAKEYILGQECVIDVIEDYDKLKKYLKNLNLNFGKPYFDYLIKHKKIDNFIYLSDRIQVALLTNKINQDKFISACLEASDSKIINDSVNVLLLDNDDYVKKLNKLSVDNLVKLSSKGIILPSNRTIINKFVSVTDSDLFYEYVELLKENNYDIASLLEEIKEEDVYFNDILVA